MSLAVEWASRVTTIAMEMVVPPVLGLWADHKLGTPFIFVAIGAVLGFCTGMLSLVQLVRAFSQPKPQRDGDKRTPLARDGE